MKPSSLVCFGHVLSSSVGALHSRAGFGKKTMINKVSNKEKTPALASVGWLTHDYVVIVFLCAQDLAKAGQSKTVSKFSYSADLTCLLS